MTSDASAQRSSAAVDPRLVSETTENVVRVVRGVVDDLYPRRSRHLHVYVDSHLERDLGLDSLARTELLLRLERVLQLEIPEALLVEAETPRDFVVAALRLRAGGDVIVMLGGDDEERYGPVPPFSADFRSLTDVLRWRAETTPERPHILLEGGIGTELVITYAALHRRALSIAQGLIASGVATDDRVAIMLPTGEPFFAAFFGTLYAGAIPVPLYPPRRISTLDDHLQRQRGIIANAGAKLLIVDVTYCDSARWLVGRKVGTPIVVTPEELALSPADSAPVARAAADIALIQYTSGSTGMPKGVVLSHENLLCNIRAMAQAVRAEPADVFVSWLPLYHDLGLIAAWLACLCYATPTVILTPLTFLAHPESWLRAIHRHRATLSGGPNFAFDFCVHRIPAERLKGLDLSSLRVLFNGAEAVSAATLRRFTERFQPFGLRPEALLPVYGLAENSVGLAFTSLGRPPFIDYVDHELLRRSGHAEPVSDLSRRAIEVVGCGPPLPGHELRIVDARDRELGERREGRIQFRGPSATRGYFRDPEATQALFRDGWLDTGDRGYLVGGELFVTGRDKDLIIRGGRNIHPVAIEKWIEDVAGVRRGAVAVFGTPDPKIGTERLIVVAESRHREPEANAELRQCIRETVTRQLEQPPDDIVLVPPHTVPKTSSGKVRRQAARQLYLSGAMDRGRFAMWLQLANVMQELVQVGSRRLCRWLGDIAFATRAWACLLALAPLVWILVLAIPAVPVGERIVRTAARLLLRLCGVPFEIEAAAPMPEGAGVLVANHASYLDVLALAAALPRLPVFVAKQELARNRLTGPFLRRLGVMFVTRSDGDAAASVHELHQASTHLRAGKWLLFFPEGTFTRQAGLLPFELGAFVCAATMGVPVVPVTLRGTRSMLRDGRLRPQRSRLTVHVAAPICVEGGDWGAAARLRDAARDEILSRCGEPDLAATPAATN